MNYRPTPWERIGGPWAITLRAYLWTAPFAVLFQPIIEPGFWTGDESVFRWISVCSAGYLAFGVILYIANKFLIPNREVKPAPIAGIILIAVFAGCVRSFVIGTLIPVFGLTGIGPYLRMPFGSIVTIFWIISSSVIMDTKYRYRIQVNELTAQQIPLLKSQKEYLTNFTRAIPAGSKTDFDKANYQIQNVFRDVIVKADKSGAEWAPVVRQAYRTVMNLIFVRQRPRRFSELTQADLISSPRDTFKVISRTPLFNIPVVFLFYFTLIFLASARILPIREAAFELTIGLLVNLLILVLSKKFIQRSKGDSSFGYLTMLAVLVLLAIIGPLFSTAPYISIFELQVFALAGTSIEIIWIIATGLLQISQNNRQKLINQATLENKLLKLEVEYWESIARRSAEIDFCPSKTLDLISSDMRNFLQADQPDKCAGAIECASTLVAEVKFVRGSIDVFSIEAEFERIMATWGQEANILWTVTGESGSELNLRKAITLIEISILRSLRNAGASIISIDFRSSLLVCELIITDNGVDHSNFGVSLGMEILQEISKNTWTQVRTGGVNKVTAQVF